MATATLHDGSELEIEVHGEGPSLLIPVNPTPIEGPPAEEMRKWGTDPALGRSLIEGLEDLVTVVAFDYEGHVLSRPKPATLSPDNVSSDILAVADAAGTDTFAYYGYSWLAVCGLQLAIRTERLAALAMGGFPPLDGPYQEMLRVTEATHRMAGDPETGRSTPETTAEPGDWSAAEVTMSEAQTRQFVSLYRGLQDFDDRTALSKLDCPRLCFVGTEDEIAYDERWDDTRVDIAGPVLENRRELEAAGWTVHALDGLDHIQAMQAGNVLPILRPWLRANEATASPHPALAE